MVSAARRNPLIFPRVALRVSLGDAAGAAAGAAGESFGYTVRATPDGGAILTGHTTEGSAGGADLMLVKVDRLGGRE